MTSAANPETDVKAFGQWLASRRAFALMTQRQVGDRVGVSWSQISRYENGEAMPRKGVKIRLQALFKSQPNGLVNRETPPKDVILNLSAIRALERMAESLHQQATEIEALASQLRESDDLNLLVTALNLLSKN